MKLVIITAVLIVGGIFALHTTMQNGQFLKYLDTHPNPKVVPAVQFYVGEGYYITRDLQNSATYYQRIVDRYPESSYADDAYYNYLLALDDMNTPRLQMADLYATYLEKYPNGKNTEIVHRKIEYCRNTR